jgi:hypothetical protein
MSKQAITAINAIAKVRRNYRTLNAVSILDAFFQKIITDAEYTAIQAERDNAYILMLVNG